MTSDQADITDNLKQLIPYEDLREWLIEADRLGELRNVKGASWQEEIGMAAELVSHDDDAPPCCLAMCRAASPGHACSSICLAESAKT